MDPVRVLMVDDEFLIRDVVRSGFSSIPDIEVVGEASHGREAITKARDLQPDIVMMDIALVGQLDGIETAKEILTQFNVPSVFITGQVSERILQRAIVAEPAGYIIKPFKIHDLRATIRLGLLKFKQGEQLKERQRTLLQEKQVLADIGQIISLSLDIEEVYERFAEEVRKLISFDRITINIVDYERGVFSVPYTVGIGVPSRQPGRLVPLAGSATEEVIRSQSGLLLTPDEGEDPTERFPGLSNGFRAGFRSFLSVPLLSKGEAIGALHLRSLQAKAYTEQDLALAEQIGVQIAGAIANAMLYADLKAAESELRQAHAELESRVEERTEQLREAIEAARAASDAKTRFLANMSHEIRTPLNGITGMIQLMRRTELTGRQEKHLDMMKTSADSLMAVINDILDISRIEAGKLELESVGFSLRELVTATMDMLAMRAQEKGLELGSYIQPDTPDALVGDPNRLRQVIINLVGNAIKFTDAGNVELRVRTESQGESDVLCYFKVTDTGIGIPYEKQGTIFDVFSQGDSSTTRRYGGSGLGLAISSQLVKMMGGHMWLKSEPGRGSTFWFIARLGLRKDAETTGSWSPETEAVESATSPPSDKSFRKLRVLLAEDNRINQALAVSMLEDWGHEVVVANDGREAVAILEGGEFDLALMDVQMPEMDGVEATKAIRDRERATGGHLPIVAMTAHAMTGDRERYLGAGMDYYIAKPISERELFRIMKEAEGALAEADRDAAQTPEEGGVIDMEAALAALGGKEERLRRMAGIFLEDYEDSTNTMRQAINDGDSQALAQVAHSLKGAVGIFAADAAYGAALKLEQMGRAGNLSGVEEAYAALEVEISRLNQALSSFLQGDSTG